MIGTLISYALVGLAAAGAGGYVLYWLGRLALGLATGDWRCKNHTFNERCAMSIIGLLAAVIIAFALSLLIGLGWAIMQGMNG